VLLVEDDEMLRRMLARTLDHEGFRVLEAGHGEAALLMVRSLSRPVDLVLTDIAMPVMDGFEFSRVFRALYPSIPVLFMSGALPRTSRGVPLLQVGTHLLLKPFGPDVLIEAVTATLTHEHPSVYRESARSTGT
jgi:DNA-binding response OmpR family regulator